MIYSLKLCIMKYILGQSTFYSPFGGGIRIFVFATFLWFSETLSAQTIMVSGIIKDSSGAPVPGAAIKIHDTKAGVSTDSLGRFSLPLKAGATLDITAIG